MRWRIHEAGWWYWLLTAGCLAASLGLRFEAVYLAVALCSVQVVHFGVRHRSLRAFPVQVRFAYLGLLAAGLWEPLRVLHGIQLVGTTAVVLVDYCFLARLMSLLPWNRRQPFSLALLGRTIFSRPVRGSILKSPAAQPTGPQRLCSDRCR